MVDVKQTLAAQYTNARRAALKRIGKQIREEAGFSKQALASYLGCARSRIIDIEKEESTSEYSLEELELLAALCGKHPLEILQQTGQEVIQLSEIVSATLTHSALLTCVDCPLPERIQQIYASSEYFPAHITISPDETLLAVVADAGDAERWEDDHDFDAPYQYTICVWESATGALVCQLELPYVERLAILDTDHLALATSRPLHEIHDARDYEGEEQLQIWNIHTQKLERTLSLLDRVGNLAVSSDGAYLAAFFPTTTTIQVWETKKWQPVHAFELETLKGDLDSLGSMYRRAIRVQQLPRERKFNRWIMDYSATRFEFMDNDVLVVGFPHHMNEFSMADRDGRYHSPIEEHPRIPWHPESHVRTAEYEVALTKVEYLHQVGESSLVELYYLEPREKRYPPDTYMSITRLFPGMIGDTRILDESCVLALLTFATPYRWGMFQKRKAALINLISGRMVHLNDADRLRDGDDLSMGTISPQGRFVAYWAWPYEKNGVPRLTVQTIDNTPLRVKKSSLAAELKQQQRQRIEEYKREEEERKRNRE